MVVMVMRERWHHRIMVAQVIVRVKGGTRVELRVQMVLQSGGGGGGGWRAQRMMMMSMQLRLELRMQQELVLLMMMMTRLLHERKLLR